MADRTRSGVAVTIMAALILASGVIVGLPAYARLPGPYLVGGDTRAVDAEGVGAAQRARLLIGPDNRIAADRTNRFLLATYGEQYVVTAVRAGASLGDLFLAPRLTATQMEIVQQGGIRFLLVDRRLSTALPAVGAYYDKLELVRGPHVRPAEPRALAKFDGVRGIDRIFDSGNIQIYDLEAWIRDR